MDLVLETLKGLFVEMKSVMGSVTRVKPSLGLTRLLFNDSEQHDVGGMTTCLITN